MIIINNFNILLPKATQLNSHIPVYNEEMLSILTFNTALQDIQFLGQSIYRPVDFVQERLLELARQLTSLSPDIICLQELFHSHLQQQVYNLLKSEYPYAKGIIKKRFSFRLGNELIVFSKYPLKEDRLYKFKSATIEERIFTQKGFFRVLLELPTGTIQLINIHMTAGGLNNHPEDSLMEKIRSLQIRQLFDSVSNELPTIIAGDLNAGPDSSKKNYQAVLDAGFIDTFNMTGNTDISWDPNNPLVISGDENHLPAQRIDHIFMNDRALELMSPTSASIVLNDHSIPVTNTRIPVSDHYGLMVHFNSQA